MNKEKIQVGEYIRTKNGYIVKITEKTNIFNLGYKEEYIDMETTIYGFPYEEQIVKHSKILAEVVEVGDYVNGNIVTDKYLFAGEKPVIETEGNDTNCKCLCEKDIKTILTHELFEANCYKMKGE